MTVLDIVDRQDPILHRKVDPFNFMTATREEGEKLARNLLETLRHWKYPGIAANEVGINARVICLESEPAYVMFNPMVTAEYGDHILLEETDITRRGIVCKLKRPQSIRVRFHDINGDVNAMRFTGMTARQILHLIDTLNGVIFYNKASSIHREMALKKYKKMMKLKKKTEQ